MLSEDSQVCVPTAKINRNQSQNFYWPLFVRLNGRFGGVSCGAKNYNDAKNLCKQWLLLHKVGFSAFRSLRQATAKGLFSLDLFCHFRTASSRNFAASPKRSCRGSEEIHIGGLN
jgi:hypothetical protein